MIITATTIINKRTTNVKPIITPVGGESFMESAPVNAIFVFVVVSGEDVVS